MKLRKKSARFVSGGVAMKAISCKELAYLPMGNSDKWTWQNLTGIHFHVVGAEQGKEPMLGTNRAFRTIRKVFDLAKGLETHGRDILIIGQCQKRYRIYTLLLKREGIPFDEFMYEPDPDMVRKYGYDPDSQIAVVLAKDWPGR